MGTERGRGQGLEKFWGFFGDGDGFDFEFFWGSIPENPQKTGMGTGIEPLKGLGILWGRGKHKSWGFFGAKTPKKPKFWGEVGARALKRFGDNLGTGQSQLLGNFQWKIPENPQISEWGRGKESRGFLPH